MYKYIFTLSLLFFFHLGFSENTENISSPPTDYEYDASLDQPEITIREEKDEFIEEYRLNGNLYMIKVTPKNMPSYYLIKYDQNGDWVRKDMEGSAVSIPMWVIGEF